MKRLVITSLFVSCGFSFGQAGRAFPMDRHDRNGDGTITKEEFAGQSKIFERMDRDGNGTVSAAELKSARERWQSGSRRQLLRGREGFSKSGSGGQSRPGRGSRSLKFRNFTSVKPKPGEVAPDFKLKTLDGKMTDLSRLAAELPVVLEFGSYT